LIKQYIESAKEKQVARINQLLLDSKSKRNLTRFQTMDEAIELKTKTIYKLWFEILQIGGPVDNVKHQKGEGKDISRASVNQES